MITTTSAGIKINTQHEYIRLNLGNGRGLTASYSGEKASGAVPEHVFEAWHKAARHDPATLTLIGVPQDSKLGDIIHAFAEYLPTLWPDWNVAPSLPKVGDTVKLNFGKRGGVKEGVVTKVSRGSVTARYEDFGLVRCAADMLED